MNDLRNLATQAAEEHGIDPALVMAICEHESNWNPYAIRYEPAFFKRYIHPAHPDVPSTMEMMDAVSFGLMQIMGETAQELGFVPKFPDWQNKLCDPATGIEYGCRKLAKCMARFSGDVKLSLLAYNGGGDASYSDKVLALMGKYQMTVSDVGLIGD